MLSGFAYSTFLTMLDRKAFKAGVKVVPVNPAYTSVIGRNNYLFRYGITAHEAAALVIARRAQRYPKSPLSSRYASPLPARNRGGHIWKYWQKIKTREGRVHHHGLYQRRSLQDSPDRAEPHRKSSFRQRQFLRPPASSPRVEKAP